MASPERARGRVSAISSSSREAPTIVVPKPEPKTVPVSPEPGKPPTKKPLIQRLAGHLAFRLAAVGIAIGAGYAAYQEVPAVHRAVDNLIGTDTVPSVPPTFDNSKDKITIGGNNITTVTPEKLSSLPSFTEDGKPILLFPIKLQPGKTVAINKELNVVFLTKDVLDKAKQEGVRDILTSSSVAPGSQFVAPIDGRMFVMEVERNGETVPVGVSIVFMSPDNTLYFLNIGPEFPQGSQIQKIINIAVDAPSKNPSNSNGREWEKGTLVKKGNILFETTQQTSIRFFLQGGTNGSLGPEGERIPGHIIFATDPSTNKIIVANQ